MANIYFLHNFVFRVDQETLKMEMFVDKEKEG